MRRGLIAIAACVPLFLALAVSTLTPGRAYAEVDSSASASAQQLEAGQVDGGSSDLSESSGGSASAESSPASASSGEAVSDRDYSNVVNEQVVGDFFFVLCADSVMLMMILGALGFLAFRPSR